MPGRNTLLLTDANFIPIPVNPGSSSPFDLRDTSSNNYGSPTGTGAYTDLSGGVFQTCETLTDCNTDTGNFAVDITAKSVAPPTVPEPAAFGLAGLGLALAAGLSRRVRGDCTAELKLLRK